MSLFKFETRADGSVFFVLFNKKKRLFSVPVNILNYIRKDLEI